MILTYRKINKQSLHEIYGPNNGMARKPMGIYTTVSIESLFVCAGMLRRGESSGHDDTSQRFGTVRALNRRIFPEKPEKHHCWYGCFDTKIPEFFFMVSPKGT